MDKIEEGIKLARFMVEYNSDGSISSTLIFDGVAYTYTMQEDEDDNFTSDKPGFDWQIQEKFPDLYPEEVIDLLGELDYYTNSDDLQELIIELSHYD